MFYDQSENEEDPSPPPSPGGRRVNDVVEGAFLAPSGSLFGPDSLGPETVAEAFAGSGVIPPPRAAYERELIRSVWEFAETVPGVDPTLWRKDEFGAWICRLDYGRRASAFGWEIFDPGIGRRTQGVYAMRPMQWESYLRLYEAFA